MGPACGPVHATEGLGGGESGWGSSMTVVTRARMVAKEIKKKHKKYKKKKIRPKEWPGLSESLDMGGCEDDPWGPDFQQSKSL